MTRWSEADLLNIAAQRRRERDRAGVKAEKLSLGNKYGAVKVKQDGYTFDSSFEAEHYSCLKWLEKCGEIKDLKVHPRYPIQIRGIKCCDVELDFTYFDKQTGRVHFVDTKGADDAMSKLKRKLVSAEYGITVELVKREKKERKRR